MIQKLLKVGSSAAVTIPKKSLEDLGLKIGDEVRVNVDSNNGVVSIRSKEIIRSGNDKITRLTLSFINRYRKDLERLANK